jgi:serine acetyltransferase
MMGNVQIGKTLTLLGGINSDISVNNRLFVGWDTSMMGNVQIGQNLTLLGGINSDVSMNNRLFVGWDTSMMGNVQIGKTLTLLGGINSDVSMNKRLFVGWDTSMLGNVQIGQNLTLLGKLTLGGDVSMNNRLFVGWDTSMMGNVQIGKLLNLTSDGSFNGSLSINGSVTIGSKPSGSSPPLYVGTSVTSSLTVPTSIYAAQSIISNGGLYGSYGTWNSSDERIKKDIQNINGVYALSMLRDIRPTQYNLIDSKMHKNSFNYGFIAQEIDLLIQNSVHKICQYLPNIFDNATILNNHIVRLKNKSTTLFLHDTSNSPVYVKFLDENNNEYFNTVTRIIDDRTFEVEVPIKQETIFVYGQEVADFHYLDKDSIFTITTAALKEVDKELQITKTELSSAKQDIQTLFRVVENLQTQMNKLTIDLAH